MLVINIEVFGIKEKVTINNKEILKWINTLSDKEKLEFHSNIDLHFDTDKQLELLANCMNKIDKDGLTPAQKRVLISFLEANINELK